MVNGPEGLKLTPKQLAQLKYQELKLQEKKLTLVENLPHRYGWRWYSWARQFYESTNQTNLLCAANQISKSSTQIRKCIEWATNVSLWPKLWKMKPLQFWYLYPSKDVANIEFDKKWIPEFLPREAFKDHPQYGWRAEYNSKKKIDAIHFNTGVSVYFKTYGQDVANLQTGTVAAIFADEELPEEIYPELRLRLAATDGYFHMVFTATLNQDFWRRAIEGTGKEEIMPEAFKQQVSMYDCMYYEDGSLGAYAEEKIDRIKAQCGSETEILRRVYGRFVTEIGRIYSAFESDRHFISKFSLKTDHRIYAGVDIGGGGSSHPAAIIFLAVEPDLKKGTIFKGWRGDGKTTTMGDILEKFKELRGNMQCLGQAFDYAAKDFGVIAQRSGEVFIKAEKSHELGEGLVNTLFRNDMLFILDDEELRKLGGELSSVMKGAIKNKAKDDFCDALRYVVTMPPWDLSSIGESFNRKEEKEVESRPLTDEEYKAWELEERRSGFAHKKDPNVGQEDTWDEVQQDFDFWNDQYGN